MRSSMFQPSRLLLSICLELCCFSLLAAQSNSPGSISGRVVLPDGNAITTSIRISLETMRGVKASVFTDNHGGFLFRSLAPGGYQVIVEGDKNLWETTAVNVEVFPGAPAILTIVLKEKSGSGAKTKSESVSASELQTQIPPKAKKEFDRASDAGRQGKRDEAIVHLRKALDYFPNYLMARNDLGAQLLEQGKLTEAEEQLRIAVALDPKAFNPHLNLGIVLVTAKRFDEAKEILKETVSLDSSSPAARLYLGQALDALNELPAAAKELTAAHSLGGDVFAVALFQLGTVYVKSGERQAALKAFEQYVALSPKGPNVTEAKRQIALLR